MDFLGFRGLLKKVGGMIFVCLSIHFCQVELMCLELSFFKILILEQGIVLVQLAIAFHSFQ